MSVTPAPQTSPLTKGKHPLSVMILDDERFDRHRMARLCSGLPMPCEVTNALTLDGFRALLDDQIYDLILVDYLLPDGTGLQALEAVRCSVRNFSSATIMITGHDDAFVADAALKVGCTDYLPKDDLTREKFHLAVTQALHRAQLSLQAETDSFGRGDVEEVLESVASQFANDLKPLVSRCLRLVRSARANPSAARITALEHANLEVWEALVAQERSSGVKMMAQTLIQPQNQTDAGPQVRAGKPPSPFARMRH